MNKEKEFPNTIVAITPNTGLRVLVSGDAELLKLMDGDLFDDNASLSDFNTFPTEPGAYIATVEYWFQQGFYEGWEAPGESEWSYRLKDVRRITVNS